MEDKCVAQSSNTVNVAETTEHKDKKAKMEELTIILLGKQGAGKSASGNTLLGSHVFHTAPSSERVTQACSLSMSTVDKQKVTVIDTPGWCDSSRFENEMKQNIIEFIIRYMPHVFLLVLPIGRFTNEEITTVMNILKEFGDEVIKYMIVLFTKGDELEERPIEHYLRELHSELKAIIGNIYCIESEIIIRKIFITKYAYSIEVPGPATSPTSVREDADSNRDAASSITTLNADVNQAEHFLITGPCKLC